MTVVVGTAGHIDHGKTSLLRALTGIDADRLPEEKARGMTIDVGYAHLRLDGGSELDFVDVPGHDKLIGNMLVGAGEIDAALLVVAADDGPRAQTVEHLELLDALGISFGVIVVTKIDAVPEERVTEARAEVGTLVGSTGLAGAPVIAASAVTGAGLDHVRDALVRLRDDVIAAGPRATDVPRAPRIAIDRVFTIRGRGTVVTGTLRGGPVAVGTEMRVVPGVRRPTVRVREIQVHGATQPSAAPGRIALNVVGDGVAAVARGAVVTTDPRVVSSDRLLVALHPAAREPSLPVDRTRVVVHLGTARMSAVVGRAGRDGQDLGAGAGSAILRLTEPVAAAPGDRFVVRRPSPAVTLAGGRVLDPDPPRGVARRRATEARLRAIADAAGAAPGDEPWVAARLDLHGALDGPQPMLAGDVAAAVDDRLLSAAAARGSVRRSDLLRTGVVELRRHVGPREHADRLVATRLDGLTRSGTLAQEGDWIRTPGARTEGPSAELQASMDRLVATLSTPSPLGLAEAARLAGCPAEGIRVLERDGRVIRVADDLAWAAPAYAALVDRAVALAIDRPLTPATLRDATGTSRKYVMAILEDLDRRAILRRTADGHVLGPRAPRPATAAPGSPE